MLSIFRKLHILVTEKQLLFQDTFVLTFIFQIIQIKYVTS